MWAISSTDPTDKLAAYAGAKGITFPLLSDADLAVTKRFDVLNYTRSNMAHPTTLVIDRKGTVRFVRIDFDFTKRPAAADLLAFLKNLKD